MNIPLVSVIIPNYNHERYLERRIESIIDQTFQDFEIIILDDCSTDRSVDIIKKYRNHNMVYKIIYNETNSGSTFKQWILGLNLCRTTYIWIAESDDFANKDFLMHAVAKLNSSDKVCCAFVESKWVDENNKEIASPKHLLLSDLDLEASNFVKNYMLGGNFVYNASATLFKKAAYLQNKETIDKNIIKYKACGDWLFWALILENYSIGLVYSTQNYFRRIENSVSAKSMKSTETSLETIDIIAFIKGHYKINLPFKRLQSIANKIISVYGAGRFNTRDNFFISLYSAKIHPLMPLVICMKALNRKISRISNPFKV